MAVILRAVTHIHSKFSPTGEQSLEAIAERIRDKGIDVFIPTDTFLATWEYGLWPLRGLVRKKVVHPSVSVSGVDRYLSEIVDLRRKYPDLLVVPGMEVAPYYRWEGAPWKKLTLVDWHRHFLILGLERPEDYKQLPVMGNPGGGSWNFGILWPAWFFVCAIVSYFIKRKRWCFGLAVIGIIFFLGGRPYHRIPESSYLPETPWKPYQRVIDYVNTRGGLVFWAHPETQNWNRGQEVADGVFLRTPPYPEAILETADSHGFGVFFEGMNKVAVPGGYWDQTLEEYCRGERRSAYWGIAELDYRKPMRGLDVDTTQIVLEAEDRTPAAVVKSLREGRFYTIRPAVPMLLSKWNLTAGDSSGTLLVELEVGHQDGRPRRARVEIVRSGQVILRESVHLPHRWFFKDLQSEGRCRSYRASLQDQDGGWLYTNPLFWMARR
ncbi:MAG: PHP domain-containing protein [Elusimicrobia bacterium]|nr:PHP domain-containing protein [Elusimicrobiota bacterium]